MTTSSVPTVGTSGNTLRRQRTLVGGTGLCNGYTGRRRHVIREK
jgi:hypothetical protein